MQSLVVTFGIILPAGGVVAVPLGGLLLDRFGVVLMSIIINASMLLVQVLQIVPVPELQIVVFVLFAMARPMMYSMCATFIAQTFGFRKFGRLWGVAALVAAAFSTTQYGLTELIVHVLGGSFVAVNATFAVVCAALFVFPVYLVRTVRALERREAADAARRKALEEAEAAQAEADARTALEQLSRESASLRSALARPKADEPGGAGSSAPASSPALGARDRAPRVPPLPTAASGAIVPPAAFDAFPPARANAPSAPGSSVSLPRSTLDSAGAGAGVDDLQL